MHKMQRSTARKVLEGVKREKQEARTANPEEPNTAKESLKTR